MTFRKARQSDLTRISEIYEAIHTMEKSGLLTIGWKQGVYPTEQTAAETLERGELFVELEGDIIVGSAVFNQVQLDSYQLIHWQYDSPKEQVMVMHTLTIAPALAGNGYGKAFARYYEQYAAECHCKILRIDTQEKNQRARAMYRSCGFRESGIVPCIFNGIPDVNLVLLEKSL